MRSRRWRVKKEGRGEKEEGRRRESEGAVQLHSNKNNSTKQKQKKKSDIPFWAFSVITVSCDRGKKGRGIPLIVLPDLGLGPAYDVLPSA
jgi:hypothetical protein